jgi:D-beta-D-heptose 7-phosphate kinase/D-beta-D-heptose 1-phosphate adenosyltransferase
MTFSELLDQFCHLTINVVGDVMLDEYLFGRISRISPEAPVMVVQQESRRCVPGGAANVALNVAALGAQAGVVGVAGNDESGDSLKRALAELPLDDGLVYVPNRPTTRKTRVVANHSHQVLRIDHETVEPVSSAVGSLITANAVRPADGILFSDYRKGALTDDVVTAVMAYAKRESVPVFVNAKPESAPLFRGAKLVTVNRSEASGCLGRPIGFPDDALDAAAELRERLQVECVVVTLGEDGLATSHPGGNFHFRAPHVEAYDVAGAGDTVVATLALGVATAGFEPKVFELAVQVAAKVVRHVGVVAPTAADLADVRSLD